jgi:hypothetical protein
VLTGHRSRLRLRVGHQLGVEFDEACAAMLTQISVTIPFARSLSLNRTRMRNPGLRRSRPFAKAPRERHGRPTQYCEILLRGACRYFSSCSTMSPQLFNLGLNAHMALSQTV